MLENKKDAFIADTQSAIRGYLRYQSPETCLTILEKCPGHDVERPPKVSTTYLGTLLDFCLKRPHKGHALDSALTLPIIDIVVAKFQKLYDESHEEITAAVALRIVSDEAFQQNLKKAIEAEVVKQGTTIPKPLIDKISSSITHMVISKTQDLLSSQLGTSTAAFLKTTVANTVGTAVSGPVMAKIGVILAHNLSGALAIQIKAVLAKIAASGALKTAIAAKIKAVILATVLGTIVHVIAAKLAAAGISVGPGAAVLIILLPLLGLYMRYEYKHLPEKLSEKVPEKVSTELIKQFDGINAAVLTGIHDEVRKTGMDGMLSALARDSSVHDALQETLGSLKAGDRV